MSYVFLALNHRYDVLSIRNNVITANMSIGWWQKDLTPLLTQWSYVFLALTRRYDHECPCLYLRICKSLSWSLSCLAGIHLNKYMILCIILSHVKTGTRTIGGITNQYDSTTCVQLPRTRSDSGYSYMISINSYIYIPTLFKNIRVYNLTRSTLEQIYANKAIGPLF